MSEEKTSVYSIPGTVVKSAQQNGAYLIVISGKSSAQIGRMHKLDRREIILGRSAEAGFQVDDEGISRKHCKVTGTANGRFQLMDLGSTNGTYLNGNRVKVSELQDGDKIQIGSNTVLKFSIQDQLEEQYQRNIYESATRDGLTRIFNKKYFLDTLRKEFAYCARHKVPLALLLFDVDKFKVINDTYGHPAGDYVLQRITQKVTEVVREEDLFARYGGEEFALLLRESGDEQALRCAERCRKVVDGAPFDFNGASIKVSISLGVANLDEAEFVEPEELIAAADRYLYRAKQTGRNKVEGKGANGG